MHSRRLYIASCLAMVTIAMAFAIRGDVLDSMGNTFGLTKQQIGMIPGAAFLGFAITVFFGSPLCDYVGMRQLLCFAWGFHTIGILMTIFAPGFICLWFATLLIGFGNGLVEAVCNPLIATMYPRDKTNKLNILHAWWPGGMIIAGLLTMSLDRILTPDPAAIDLEYSAFVWKVKMALVIAGAFCYGVLILGQKFPPTERVASNISAKEMLWEAIQPAFLLWFAIMWLTAATELGPMQWIPDIITKSTGTKGMLVFTFINIITFGMRYFAGPIVHRLSALGLLTCSSILSTIGLLALGFTTSPVLIFVAAGFYATGICYFWPTMLGVTSERFPKGGAFLLGIMGLAGNLSIFMAVPVMGLIYDVESQKLLPKEVTVEMLSEQVGLGSEKNATTEQKEAGLAAKAQLDVVHQTAAPKVFRWVAISPLLLTIIFAVLWSFGGYKQIHLSPQELARGEG